jgi:hypothetical protein
MDKMTSEGIEMTSLSIFDTQTSYTSRKDFRKEITKIKKNIRLWMEMNVDKNNKNEDDVIRNQIFSSIDNLPILFMNRRKKTIGGDDPAKNLIGFGKPTMVGKKFVEFLSLNFGVLEGKSFSEWFPCLFQFNVGSRIQLQSIFNLIIRITKARMKEKKRQQIAVNKIKNMDTILAIANELFLSKNMNPIQNKDTITSSDILKIINIFVQKDSELSQDQKKFINGQRNTIRDENILSRKLLESFSTQA